MLGSILDGLLKSPDYLWVSHPCACMYVKNITLVEAIFNPKAEERSIKAIYVWDFILFQEDFFNNILFSLLSPSCHCANYSATCLLTKV